LLFPSVTAKVKNSRINQSMTQAIRSTRVFTPAGFRRACVLMDGGRIREVREWADVPAGAALHDYGELAILPGLVDSHVHINEPGRTEWEGFETATRAALSGGVTTLVDMPLNCLPETVDTRALEAKRRAAAKKYWCDWAAWGGVVRGNSAELLPLADAGVPGFKCFLIHSGIETFQWVEERDLRDALKVLRSRGLPLLAHAELSGPVERATAALSKADWRSYGTYLASRPDEAEVEAIRLLIALAEEFDVQIHIVHLSSARALPLIREAKSRGVKISIETCPHYLWFAAEEIPDGATEFKCAPPIRSAENRELLWAALNEGLIEMVATDHSPCPPSMKKSSNLGDAGYWDKAWGGIASLGLELPVMWTSMRKRGIPLERVGEWMAARPAALAGMSGKKGAIVAGADADFAVFDPNEEWQVKESDLHFRHKLSPYMNAELQGRVRATLLRGDVIYSEGNFHGTAHGLELLREQVRVAESSARGMA
jgi:allantoinase